MRPNAAGLSNTDGMRIMIRSWTGMPEPALPVVQTRAPRWMRSAWTAPGDYFVPNGTTPTGLEPSLLNEMPTW